MGILSNQMAAISPKVVVEDRLPVIKMLPSTEIEKDIHRLCFVGMHRNDLFSTFGKMTTSGIPYEAIIANAQFFEQYISPESNTMKNTTVVQLIEQHRKDYGHQLGSRPYEKKVDYPKVVPPAETIIPPAILTQSNDGFLKNVFFPNWDNKPAPIPAVLSLAGTPILSHQNMAALIANPGAGKSSSIEAICASLLNPDCDSLGFSVAPSCRGIIGIDSERTNPDVWNSFYRTIVRRAKIPEGTTIDNLILAGMRSVARLPERIKVIEHLLNNHPCSLLLIDGAGDLVYDTNDLAQAIECRIWLREITVKYDLSVFVTLHPNPNTDKPRGHQGSEICREAESVLLAKAFDDDTKIITTDFQHGKNRNNGKLTTAYRWSDEDKMFVSIDYEDMAAGKKTKKDEGARRDAEVLAKVLLPPPTALRRVDLIEAMMQKTSQSEPTAARKIKDMTLWGIIKKNEDGYYRFNMGE